MQVTIKNNETSQIIEKKSKFIANIFYVQSQEEAENLIKETKKKYYDARHNCYAYSISTDNGILNKFSDDGEPAGTAGAPMLNILNKNELVNVLVIVTRYFGGILLGTGGLVKAYSQVTLDVIEKTQKVIEEEGYEIQLILDYSEFEKLNYYCQKNQINIISTNYDEKINCILEMTKQAKDKIIENKEELNFKIQEFKIIKTKKIRKNIEK